MNIKPLIALPILGAAGVGLSACAIVLPDNQDDTVANAQRRQDAFAAQLGVNELVNTYMERYDRSGNGTIDLTSPKPPIDMRAVQEDERVWPAAGDSPLHLVETAYSLLRSADTDGDKTVTREELGARITKFDADNDGALDGGVDPESFEQSEAKHFSDAHGLSYEFTAGRQYHVGSDRQWYAEQGEPETADRVKVEDGTAQYLEFYNSYNGRVDPDLKPNQVNIDITTHAE